MKQAEIAHFPTITDLVLSTIYGLEVIKMGKDTLLLTDADIKKELTKILCDFSDYCNENQLLFFLEAGTLLGAIRHKGFIPWDDDIDVAMPRKDYDRLHELIRKKPIGGKYRLESITAENSPYPFAKLVNTETSIINTSSSLHTGLWIDIFPFDGYPSFTEEERIKELKRIRRWSFLLENACCNIGSGKTILRKLVKTVIIMISKIKGAEYYGKQIDKRARNYSIVNCSYVVNYVWGGLNAKTFLTKDELFTVTDVEFEGKIYKAPVAYDKYLISRYGNYHELPPENQRINHNIQAIYLCK